MGRVRRRKPVPISASASSAVNESEQADDILAGDEIDAYVAERHRELQSAVDSSSSSEDEGPGLIDDTAVNVMDIELSSSESDSGAELYAARERAARYRTEDEEDGDYEEGDEKAEGEESDMDEWGARRKSWYGGDDVNEYEIMSDEERAHALKEEEEEATRLQKKALAGMLASDFLDEDEDEGDIDDDGDDDREDDEEAGDAYISAQETLATAAPELPVLARELKVAYKEAKTWEKRFHWGRFAQTRYHLCTAYATNVVFYMALRTDPLQTRTDNRKHPVMERIVKLRELLKEHRTIEIPEPEKKETAEEECGQNLLEKDVEEENNKKRARRKEKRKKRKEKRAAKIVEVGDEDAPEEIVFSTEDPGANIDVNEKSGLANEVVNVNGDGCTPAEGEKKTKRRKRNRRKHGEKRKRITDDALVESLIVETQANADQESGASEKTETATKERRRKLNSATGAIESDLRNRAARVAGSVDIEHMRDADAIAKKKREQERKQGQDAHLRPRLENGIDGGLDIGEADDDKFMEELLPKKKKRRASKEAAESPHVYTFEDKVDKEERRRASAQVVMNRGLTRYRPREKKIPRTKNKLAYKSAVKRRKGMVRDPVAVKPGLSYGGEATGINVRARRGARLSDV